MYVVFFPYINPGHRINPNPNPNTNPNHKIKRRKDRLLHVEKCLYYASFHIAQYLNITFVNLGAATIRLRD